MRILRPTLLIGTSLIVALAAGEILVRALDVIDRVNGFPRKLFQASDDPDLKYTMRPNVALRVRSIDVKTNSLGMRAREVPFEPPADTWRILVVGDSVAFGEGLPVEQAFPALLEARLRADTQRPVEVLSGGVEGYNTLSELAFFRDVGVKLHPGTLVIAFSLNDWDRAPAIDPRGFLTRDPNPQRKLSLIERSELLPVVLVAITEAYKRLRRRRDTTPADPRGFSPFDLYVSSVRKAFWASPRGEGLAELEAGLSGFAEEARQRRLQVVVAILPDGDQLHTDKPDLNPQVNARALCERFHLPSIDLYPAFRESPEWPLFFDIMHPNAAGHAIIARQLAGYLEAPDRGRPIAP